MPKPTVSWRMPGDLKKRLDSYCEEFGVSRPDALNRFVAESLERRGFANGEPNSTLLARASHELMRVLFGSTAALFLLALIIPRMGYSPGIATFLGGTIAMVVWEIEPGISYSVLQWRARDIDENDRREVDA